MSDKTTALIERDHLSELIHATAAPEVSAHTIPRALIAYRDPQSLAETEDDVAGASPLAIMMVLGMLIALFVAVVQL